MSIALQNAPQVLDDDLSNSPFTLPNVVVNAGTDRILVATVHLEGDNGNVLNCTGLTRNGQALTRIGRGIHPGAGWSSTEMWYLLAPNVGTFDLVGTLSAGCHRVMGAYVLTGVDQTTPFRTAATAEGIGGTSATATVGSVVTGDYLIDALTVDGTGHAIAPGANQVERYDVAAFTGCDCASDTQDGADGGVMSHTWTTAGDWTQVAVAFQDVDVPTTYDYSNFPKPYLRTVIA